MMSEFYEELEEDQERPFNATYFRRMIGYLRPYGRELVWAGVGIVMSAGIRLFEPYLIGVIVDKGVTAGDLATAQRLVILMVVLHLLGWLGNYFRTQQINIVGQGVLYDLRQQLFSHVQTLSLRFYDQRPVGRIMSRITSDVNAISQLIQGGFTAIISEGIIMVGVLLVMVWMNWKLTLIACITIPLLWVVMHHSRTKVETGWKNVRKTVSNISAHLNESVNGMSVTQAFGQGGRHIGIFQGLTLASNQIWMKTVRSQEIIWPAIEMIGVGGTGLVILVGASMVFNETLSLGFMLAFINYLWRFWQPLSAMSQLFGLVLSAMASAERIFAFLDTPPEVIDKPNAYLLPLVQGNVRFDGVQFRYNPDQPLVLKDINLDVQKGETIALVGPTGAGKSSIINLLMRFYDPVAGRILIDGHDLQDVQLVSLRQQMAMVLQDGFLFAGTIADNIRYGRPTASEEEVQQVARMVHLDSFVQTLTDKYNYEVGERGNRLSVGQRQLVSFARALLADPRILILDEATSSVDLETERVIQQAMQTLLQGRTAFIIAHRLATIRHAHRILVIESGQIAEAGTHEELLKQKGRYYDLYVRQFVGRREKVTNMPLNGQVKVAALD